MGSVWRSVVRCVNWCVCWCCGEVWGVSSLIFAFIQAIRVLGVFIADSVAQFTLYDIRIYTYTAYLYDEYIVITLL